MGILFSNYISVYHNTYFELRVIWEAPIKIKSKIFGDQNGKIMNGNDDEKGDFRTSYHYSKVKIKQAQWKIP